MVTDKILKTMESFLFNIMISVNISMRFIFVIFNRAQSMKLNLYIVIKNMEQYIHLLLKKMMIILYNYINLVLEDKIQKELRKDLIDQLYYLQKGMTINF